MAFAKCVKPCPYAYGNCAGFGIQIKPSIVKNNPQYLKSDNGDLYCYNGRFLNDQDMICEDCGEEFVPYREEMTTEFLTYRCPSCEKVVKTTYE